MNEKLPEWLNSIAEVIVTSPQGDWPCGGFPRDAAVVRDAIHVSPCDDTLALIQMLIGEIERLQAIMKAKDVMLALYNDEDACNVEFDTQGTLDKFIAAEQDLAAASAAGEKP